jgi:hypothetical protein
MRWRACSARVLRARLGFLTFLALLTAACAAPRPAPAPGAARAPLPKLPRSSVAAVLARGQELSLDDSQVHALRKIDDELAERQSVARREGAAGRPPPAAAPVQGQGAQEGEGHRGGGPRAGAKEARHAAPRPADPDALWDDNDTEAFHEAEALLRPDQLDRARDIAEQFRERLYDVRAARESRR